MAEFDDIPDAARREIARKAASMLFQLDSVGLGAPGQKLVLGSTLGEEMLSLDAVQAQGASAPEPTGHTFSILGAAGDHPVLGAGPGQPPGPAGYVRAKPSEGGAGWSIASVSSSDLAGRIEKAIAWIDKKLGSDLLLRVLTVPAYQVTALSLYRGTTPAGVVVVTPPQGPTSIKTEQLYTSEEFQRLLQAQPPAAGLVP